MSVFPMRRSGEDNSLGNTVLELLDIVFKQVAKVSHIWKKYVGFGIRKKTIGHSKSILRGFLRASGLSVWWEAGKNGDNGWNKARKWGGVGGGVSSDSG